MPTTTKPKSQSAVKAASKNGKPAKAAVAKPKAAKPEANEAALGRKLGIDQNHVVVLIDAPTTFPEKLEPLPKGVELRHSAMRGAGFDTAVLFVPNVNTLNRRFSQLAKLMRPGGGLWVAFPKKGSGFITDLTEENVRPVGSKEGLVDVKVSSFDATWSGMRFVAKASVAVEVK